MNSFYRKKIVWSYFLYFSIVLILISNGCKNDYKPYQELNGKCLGKDYNIIYHHDTSSTISLGIDSVILSISSQIDRNNQNSSLSRFNNCKDTFYVDPVNDFHFIKLWQYSKSFFDQSNGILDPTMAPLFDFYGGGYDKKKTLSKQDSLYINKLILLKTFSSLQLNETATPAYIVKSNKDIKIDFAAIQTGYIVDRIASYLDNQKRRNYFIDIDGKCRAKGVARDKSDWTYGVNRISSMTDTVEKELPLVISNKSIASSGSYTNVKASSGIKYAYIIDPTTGYSRVSDMLSTTVIANDCITADAFATTFISLGLEKSMELIKSLKGVGACFIYDTEGDGKFEFQISEGFSKNYLHNEQK